MTSKHGATRSDQGIAPYGREEIGTCRDGSQPSALAPFQGSGGAAEDGAIRGSLPTGLAEIITADG